jgi:hypothetical protein
VQRLRPVAARADVKTHLLLVRCGGDGEGVPLPAGQCGDANEDVLPALVLELMF